MYNVSTFKYLLQILFEFYASGGLGPLLRWTIKGACTQVYFFQRSLSSTYLFTLVM